MILVEIVYGIKAIGSCNLQFLMFCTEQQIICAEVL